MTADEVVRRELLALLDGGNACTGSDEVVADSPLSISTARRRLPLIPFDILWNTSASLSGISWNSSGSRVTCRPIIRRDTAPTRRIYRGCGGVAKDHRRIPSRCVRAAGYGQR